MTPTPAPTSYLEAVNLMLATIGESPVNSLDTASTTDVSTAVRTLHETNREVQLIGWVFNTEKDVTLAKDNTGKVYIPNDAARVEVSRSLYSDCDPVQRGNQLYDRKNRTYVFTKDIVAERLITFLPFDKLPEAARYFITVRAARKFQDRVQGSEAIHNFTSQDELVARAALAKDQAEQNDLNILNAPGVWNVLYRGRGVRRWV